MALSIKNHRVPFKTSLNKNPIPFTHVFTDVWGPFSTLPALDHKYCLLWMTVPG